MRCIKKWGLTLQEVLCPVNQVYETRLVSCGKIVVRETEIRDVIRHFQSVLQGSGARKLHSHLKHIYVGINERTIQSFINEEKSELRIEAVVSMQEKEKSRDRSLGPVPDGQYQHIIAVLQGQGDGLEHNERRCALRRIKKWGISLEEVLCPIQLMPRSHLVCDGKIVVKDSDVREIILHFRRDLKRGAKGLLQHLKDTYVGLNERNVQAIINEEKAKVGPGLNERHMRADDSEEEGQMEHDSLSPEQGDWHSVEDIFKCLLWL